MIVLFSWFWYLHGFGLTLFDGPIRQLRRPVRSGDVDVDMLALSKVVCEIWSRQGESCRITVVL